MKFTLIEGPLMESEGDTEKKKERMKKKKGDVVEVAPNDLI